MDGDRKVAGSSSGRDRRADGRRQSSDDAGSKSTAASRQSPASLAPLEHLQNQRRGSITDPSLHASPKPQSRISLPHSRPSASGPRPQSPYILGEPSVQPKHPLAGNGGISHPRKNSAQDGSDMNKHRHSKEDDRMEIEGEPSSTSTAHGAKRKVPSSREEPTTQHIDPQLVGPGISTDAEGPAHKRRGSGVDTQKIAQLSLNERRNSPDLTAGPSGAPSPHIQWWSKQNRREAASGNGRPAAAGAAGGAAGIATFTWPHSNVAGQVNMLPDPNQHIQGPPPFDPSVQMQMMSPVNFAQDRRISAPENPGIPSSSGPTRALRSRSRARDTDQASTQLMSHDDASSSGTKDDGPGGSRQTPYSRSPELRVSHKLAERKRRKEMKDLFDELRDQLPQDRGMKASKWEILSKAIDFIVTMKQTHGEMSREIEMLRHEVDGFRQGMPPFHHGGPPPQVMFGVPAPYPPPGGPVPPHHGPHPGGPPPTQQPPPGNEPSRPGSSQNSFPPGSGPNGDAESRTGTPSS